MVTKVVPFNLEAANKHKANAKREETKKRIFNQSILMALKIAIEKLVQNFLLREQMLKELAAVDLENAHVQSLKDVWAKLFLAILNEINQKGTAASQLTPLQRKTVNEKLDNLSKDINNLVSLKAEFASEQQDLADHIDAIEADLLEIESELAAPRIEPDKLRELDKRAGDLGKKVDSAIAKIDDWLGRFSKASEAKEKSLEDLITYTSKIDVEPDFIKLLEESFGMSSVNALPEEELLHTYRIDLKTVSARIAADRLFIGERLEKPHAPTPYRPAPYVLNRHMFHPHPSFANGRELEKVDVRPLLDSLRSNSTEKSLVDDQDNSLLSLFNPKG